MKFLYTKEKLKDILDQLGNIAEKGEKGDKGDTGAKGEQGIQGERGLKGDKGTTGAKGEAGKDGVNGDTVIDANSGTPVKIWIGTQSEYDLVTEKDPKTLYMVKQ